MTLGSTLGLLVTLVLLLPGGIGDVLMRNLTRMHRPRNDFRQLLSAVAWSGVALTLVELTNAATTSGAFGDYLIVPASSIGSAQAAASLAGRYLVFAACAVTLPVATRWLGARLGERVAGWTLDEPTIDRLIGRMPKHETKWHYARIQLDDQVIEGFVDWATRGSSVTDAAYIIKEIGKETRVWVPIRRAKWVMMLDPADWPDWGRHEPGAS